MPPSSLIRNLIAGELKQNFIITPSGESHTNILGGSLTHAAVGLSIWEQDNGGLISRVGEDFPRQWIKDLRDLNFDTNGIRILPNALDLRQFLNYTDSDAAQSDNPVASYADLGQPFPKALLGYTPPLPEVDSRTRTSDETIRIKMCRSPTWTHPLPTFARWISTVTNSSSRSSCKTRSIPSRWIRERVTCTPSSGMISPCY